MKPLRAVIAAVVCGALLSGCAVIAVVDTAATVVVGTVGLAAGAVIGTAKIAGKAVGKAADVVVGGD